MGKKITSLLLSLVLIIAMLPAMSGGAVKQVSAATAGIVNGETYTIVSAYNGKAITQTDMSTFYANCVVWNAGALTDLGRWKFEERGNYYSFTNIVSGKSMKICGTTNGSTADFNGYDNSDDYKWELEPITSGTYAGCYYIASARKNGEGGRIYAEVISGDSSNNDGAQVRLWTKQENEPRQIWRIERSGAEGATFTEAMADQALAAFKNKYFVNNSLGDGFWGIAEVMEAMLDGYETTGKPVYKEMFVGTYNKFLSNNGDYWTWNNYNDDIAWASIASVRAYMLFGEQRYLDIAKKNFDFMYSRASTFGGGLLRWCEENGRNTSSNACINGPATVCAAYLGMATGDESYWEKARTVYMAQRNSNLYVPEGNEAGWVRDCIGQDGSVLNFWASTYNQGTYLGSAVLLYEHFGDQMYYTDAGNIMNYVLRTKCYNNILREENTNEGDLSGMRGILMRYVRKFIVDLNKGEYFSFFKDNARVAWMNRNSSNIMQCAWQNKTPENVTWDSFAAYNAISLMANMPGYRDQLERSAYSNIEAEDMDYCKGLISENSGGTSGGRSLGGVQNGHYAAYYNINFGNVGCSQITFNYSKAFEGDNAVGTLEFRLGSTDGEIIATADIRSTGDWSTWNTVTVDTTKKVTGVNNIYVVFKSNTSYVCNFDYFKFTEKSVDAFSKIPATSFDDRNGVVIDRDADGNPHNIGGVVNGTWVLYQNVIFGNRTALSMELNYASDNVYGSGYMEVYADSMEGTPIGIIDLPNTGPTWNDYADLKANLTTEISGTHDIYIRFITTNNKPYVANLAWFTFSTEKLVEETTTEPETTTPEETTTEPETTTPEETTTEPEQTESVETTSEPEQTESVETSTEDEQTESIETTTESEQTEPVETSTEEEQTEPVETTKDLSADETSTDSTDGETTTAPSASETTTDSSAGETTTTGATETTTQAPGEEIDPDLPAPVGLVYSGNKDLPYYFAWAEVKEAEGYQVYVNGKYVQTVPTQSVNLDPDLFPTEGEYTIAVRSVRGNKVSEFTAITYDTVTGETGTVEAPTEPEESTTDSSAGETTTEPSAGETTTDLSAGETTTDSSVGDATTEPSAGETTTDPSAGETTTDSSAGETTTDPSEGEITTDSSAGEATTDPSAGETTTAPSEGETTTDPSAGESTTDASAGEVTTDASAGETTTVPTAGETTTDASAGEITTADNSEAAQMENEILNAKNDDDPAGSTFGKLRARVLKTTKNSNKVTWKKVKGATKYIIYGAKCGTKITKLAEVTTKSYTHKKLKKGTYYKYLVMAVDDKGEVLAISKMVHSATKGGKKGNAKKLKLNKSKVTLNKGKKFKLRAKQIVAVKKTKIKNHRSIYFESSNEKVVTVTKKGVLKAKGRGSCTVYVYAQNGVYKAVKVTVK